VGSTELDCALAEPSKLNKATNTLNATNNFMGLSLTFGGSHEAASPMTDAASLPQSAWDFCAVEPTDGAGTGKTPTC
jgi:hypothetical protein